MRLYQEGSNMSPWCYEAAQSLCSEKSEAIDGLEAEERHFKESLL